MEMQSWVCTLITQLTLCVVLYIALNIGQPQKPLYRHGNEGGTKDVYFISLRGGSRPLKQQSHLLNQIEKVAKAYKVEFVINISELGEDDPLLQNATWYFPSLKVPWYTTRAQKGQATDYFVKWIKISHGKTLAVVVLNTGSLQVAVEIFSYGGCQGHLKQATVTGKIECIVSCLIGLMYDEIPLHSFLPGEPSVLRFPVYAYGFHIRHIAVGFHPLVNCGQNLQRKGAKENIDPLYHMLLKYGVNAYLSGQPCLNDDVPQRGMSHISSNSDLMVAGPYFSPMTRESLPDMEQVNGFLLHRVSALEIVTFVVTVEGDIVNRSSIHQRGREVM